MLLTVQTYYDLLRVKPTSPSTEIVAAFHAAKSMVSQSLRDSQTIPASEAQRLIQKLEEAFYTLSDAKRRREYDDLIKMTAPSRTEKEIPQPGPLPQPFTGAHLRQYRESCGFSCEDVFKATRIPIRFLMALEENDKQTLPSRVYVHGFLKNLAQLYQISPIEVPNLYLQHLETLH